MIVCIRSRNILDANQPVRSFSSGLSGHQIGNDGPTFAAEKDPIIVRAAIKRVIARATIQLIVPIAT